MKIAFHTPNIDVRGTCVSLYDYAHYNEEILKNKSVIVIPEECLKECDDIALIKFCTRFQLILYRTTDDLETILRDCDILYTIKYGKNDGLVSKTVKTVVHCVFDMSEPHGDVYAAVSSTLAKKYGQSLFVPHMIGLPPSSTQENMREALNIPSDAIVFGRHGGQDTFNLPAVHTAIARVVHDCSNIYFIFINTPVFYIHPRIIHFGKIVSAVEKTKFICTCDAHLECSSFGHSFGLSIGEFSVNNKPIIVYNGWVWNKSHMDILGQKGIYFETEEELYNILTTFNPKEYENKDNNCYRDYSPEKVMQQFKKVFIDSVGVL